VSDESVREKAAQSLRDLMHVWSSEDGGLPPLWALDPTGEFEEQVVDDRLAGELEPPAADTLEFWTLGDVGVADDDGDEFDVEYLLEEDDDELVDGSFDDGFTDDEVVDTTVVPEDGDFELEFERAVAIADARLAELDPGSTAGPVSTAQALASLLLEAEVTNIVDLSDVTPLTVKVAPRPTPPAPTPAVSSKAPAVHLGQSSFVDLNVPIQSLILDPGDELPVADHPDTEPHAAAFIRAYGPLSAYLRLRDQNLEDLVTTMLMRKSLLVGPLLVRPYDDASPYDNEAQAQRYVVVDGSRRVAALRWVEQQARAGRPVPHEIETLIDSCPVKVIQPGADPALVLALMGDLSEKANDDPWFHRQHRRMCTELEMVAFHDPQHVVDQVTNGDRLVLRRYHAYKALQQMKLDPVVAKFASMKLFPVFHEAVGRPVVREWLDWNSQLYEFTDFDSLEVFYSMLVPRDATGRTVPAQIATRDDVSRLSEVLRSTDARGELMEERNLAAALRVLRGEGARHVDQAADSEQATSISAS
jgi:hypothetical protein